ncbi:hypothetical protein JG687_00011293 [Phytophthora cactorum]|uniref:Uncharacterized protein n=1 Tax=Phytophthora cactorum TaxID=29920 RepID=A0A8T1U512_9STRA|nr:hypothetical protein JG687_00011293 [Phytophthora cactorum]
MLLALFLYPLHVRVAVAIHKESPRLRFLERLCGYGIYYYRRYVGTDKESDIESLSADLHAWYRGVFVNGSIVRFNGDIGQYWRFAGDIREDSKLPKLAAIILSIAVNTATCKDISAIRQLDRAENEGKELVELKRIVAAAEREHVEENQVIVHQEIPSEDTAECWQDIFNVLDGDEFMSEELPITEDDELKQKVFDGFEETIPETDTTEFPRPM